MIERLTSIHELPVEQVQIGERLRDVSPEGVENLIETITANGFVGRVLVRRTKKGDFVLDGAHRLSAMRQMGHATIPCDVIRCSDDEARLFEIDGNLAGSGMTSLQIAYFMARRREAHQRLNPDARQGYAGAAARMGSPVNSSSLALSIARTRGITPRQVYKIMAAGASLGPDEYRKLSTAPHPVDLKDLEQLAKITETGERYFVIAALAEGKAKKASAARKAYRAERGDGQIVPSPTDAEHKRLSDAWRRASKAARRRFLEDLGNEVRGLLDEIGDGE